MDVVHEGRRIYVRKGEIVVRLDDDQVSAMSHWILDNMMRCANDGDLWREGELYALLESLCDGLERGSKLTILFE